MKYYKTSRNKLFHHFQVIDLVLLFFYNVFGIMCLPHDLDCYVNLPCFELFQIKCNVGEDATMLIVVMDAKFEQLKPKQRVVAIKNLSGFLSLNHVCNSICFLK
jgi:hypothetical protein